MVLSNLVLQYMLNGTGLPLQSEERSKPIYSLLGLTCLLVEVALVNTQQKYCCSGRLDRHSFSNNICALGISLD